MFNGLIKRSNNEDALMDDLENTLFNTWPMRMPIFNKLEMFKADVIDNGDSVTIECDIPGMNKEDISIEVEDDCITISGEKNTSKEDKEDKRYIRRERVYGSFSRTFSMEGFDKDNVTAKFENGVLYVKLAKIKKPEVETKKISIE